jgi:hypothetical protein
MRVSHFSVAHASCATCAHASDQPTLQHAGNRVQTSA